MASTLDRVIKCLREQASIPNKEKVSPDASFVDDLGLDSLDTVELIMACEEEFGVSIPDDEAEKVITVKDAVEVIDSLVQQ